MKTGNWAVDDAADWNLYADVNWAVDRAVERAVDRAVERAVKDSPHPGLQDFLIVVRGPDKQAEEEKYREPGRETKS